MFEKEQVKVHKIGSEILLITTHRPLEDNHRWSRFERQYLFEAPDDDAKCCVSFRAGSLFVKMPKITTKTTFQPPFIAIVPPGHDGKEERPIVARSTEDSEVKGRVEAAGEVAGGEQMAAAKIFDRPSRFQTAATPEPVQLNRLSDG
ncbi:unnamed protein product [Linum trigynum]